jgi:hypothetical protein
MAAGLGGGLWPLPDAEYPRIKFFLTGDEWRLWFTSDKEKLDLRRMRRRNCKRCRLLGVTLALTLCLTAGSSQAADLVIDDYTYTLDSDVSFNNLYIGKVSTGALNQTGGTNTVGGTLFLGFNSGASGAYSLNSGSLFTNGAIIGNGGTGTFIQTGGTNMENGHLYLGYSSGSSGTYNQTGGTNTVASILFLGFNSGTSGTYSLSGGIFSTGFGFVGYQGHGVFNQSGGISNIGYNLQLGFSSGSSGTYNLSGGSPAPLILFLEHQNIQGTVHSYIICQSNPRI